MSDLLAARLQMAVSLGFHIIFAEIGIAMPLLMVLAEWRYRRTGDGVYLQISKWKTRAWVFRYERFGKAHYMGLGPCRLISLAQARAKGRDAQRMLLDGDEARS